MTDTTERLHDMVDVLDRIADYYTTPEECAKWFRSPQLLLGNETPIELIAAGRKEDLLRVWDKIYTGVYV